MSKVKIILNGEEKFFDQNITIFGLISKLNLDIKKIAVEKNLEIVFPENFSNTKLEEGDKIEIVYFIGGG
jgi:thiamine biosynthesis protein ThiS